ncbi:LANO_0H04852g1_1 [Lachancea nothofagi CBS 11611]|uniref:LANO_0H04852g1_1 n=1 Tax=Lachancea nothofagi CBS 11611 TaxID=1266666 RepID=A0A1G4KLG5_9SACH|nr:LANO_0H04852g1_1 [Lachancea nothofagi CBS 11611]
MSGKKLKNKNQLFKRQKVIDARTIRAEALSSLPKAANELSESGSMLKVSEFMASREFEVKQLQSAILKSKSTSSTRVFQALPRKLRRRTASHNVKRIPKRLRNRALREMRKSEQTVTKGTQTLSKKRKYGLTAKQLYKARMAVKLLRLAAKSKSMKLALPADATASHHKLRSRIKALQKTIREHASGKLQSSRNNRLGSYDCTGFGVLAPKPIGRIKYLKRQNKFTWLPSHVWNAKRSHMLKRWGYQIPWSPTQKCFKLTHKLGNSVSTSDGAMCSDTSYMGTMILASDDAEYLKQLISQLTKKRGSLTKYRASHHWFEGVVFDDSKNALGPINLLWLSFNKCMLRLHPAIYPTVFERLTASDNKKLTVHDCRYSIASITLTGAKSLNALSQVLRSTELSQSYCQFKKVAYITDINLLPQRTMFAFNAMDPRHLSNPKKLANSKPVADDILQLQDQFPQSEIVSVLEKLADPIEREKTYSNQLTLKELAARRRSLLGSTKNSNVIPFNADGDPSFPIIISKLPKQELWVVILPWFWHLPLWYQLNRVSRVHHMGLRQLQQLSYERHRLYFPDDYPFTQVGNDENSLYKKAAQKNFWSRKPVSKRVNYAKIPNIHSEAPAMFPGEVGDPFCCDWRFLQILRNGLTYLKSQGNECVKMFDASRTSQFDELNLRKLTYVNDLVELYGDVCSKNLIAEGLPLQIVTQSAAKIQIETPDTESAKKTPQQTVVSTALPVIAVSCELLERGHPKDTARIYSIPQQDLHYWESIVQVSSRPSGRRNHDTAQPIPSLHNLIGFATSGTFHLGQGQGVCTGFIDSREAILPGNNYVLIRNVGTNVYRIAKWKQIVI